MNFKDALEAALDGDALLFVGAGFSVGATNSRGKTIKTGAELGAHLCTLLGRPFEPELQDVAEAFIAARGTDGLHTEVMAEFRAISVAKHHAQIAGVPWRRVYTTNYDSVFELASPTPIRPVTLSERPRDIAPNEHICVHLNGYVERITSASGDEIRLSDTSYITAGIEASPWSATFRQDLALARAVFFVGYSMADLDISRLIAATESLEGKTFFIIGQNPSSRTQTRCARFGTLLRFDAAWFGKQIESKRLSYTPPEYSRPSWYCLQPFQPPITDPTSGSDKAAFDLFVRGIADVDLLWNSLNAGSDPYIVRRSLLGTALDLCCKSNSAVVVHSKLGNGKTVFVESIKALAASEGHEVFSLVRRSSSLETELSAIASNQKPLLLVVDGYASWIDALEFLGRHKNDKLWFLLTARTGSHDVLVDRLEEVLSGRQIHEIRVDRLDASELEATNNLLEHYGLWGTKAALSRTERLDHLKVRCRGEWQSILVELFQAPQIAERFDRILSGFSPNGSHHRILIGSLALTILNERASTNMLVDLFGSRVLEVSFRNSEHISEFIDFGRGEVRNRSSVAAQFILGRIANPNTTVDVLVEMARALDKYVSSSRQYVETLRTLVQFSQLETVLPNRDLAERRAAAFSFYERIKNLDYCRTTPQFWLQYAIASLVFEDFERAQRYFESAYSFASRIDRYDTHKIDNHYARLLLEKATRSGSRDVGMRLFREARKILFEQIQRERLHYPYRVANGLGEFFDTYAGSLMQPELDEILNAVTFIQRRIVGLTPELQSQRYVRRCSATMSRIESLITSSRSLGLSARPGTSK